MHLGVHFAAVESGSDVEWGTVGEWVSGLGALAAAVVAVVIPLVIWRHDRRQRDRDERRSRSTAVNAWSDFGEDGEGHEVWIIVLNSGVDPITDWSVSRLTSTPSGDSWMTVMSNRTRGTLHPGRSIQALLDPGEGAISVQVTFIDSAGEKWWREGAEVKPV